MPTVVLVLSDTSISESGGVSTVTATLSGKSSAAVTLTVAAEASTGAVAGDFNLSSATTLTIAAGGTTSAGTVTVTAVGNNVAQGSKRVTVSATLSHATTEAVTLTVSATAAGGRGMANPANATLTLRDDEATADVNGDGAIGWQDGLLMYYAYNFEGTFRLEDDVGRRVRGGILGTLRGPGSPAANDAGYKAMLNNAWRLRPSS